MSQFIYMTDIREVEVDNNGDFITAYDDNLPHHDELAKMACDEWNGVDIKSTYSGILKDQIASCKMTYKKDEDNKTLLVVKIITVPGFRLSEKRRNEIIEQTSAQFSDGIGESIFHNIITCDDGKRVYAE